jgi:hypothetical protein
MLILVEGWDASSKDGLIKLIIEHLDPRETRMVTLGKPSDRARIAFIFGATPPVTVLNLTSGPHNTVAPAPSTIAAMPAFIGFQGRKCQTGKRKTARRAPVGASRAVIRSGREPEGKEICRKAP